MSPFKFHEHRTSYTMGRTILLAIAVLLLLLPPLVGCGGGGSPSLAVTALVPEVLDSEIPTAFEVQGGKFGAAGDAVTVRLEAVTGTPFAGGTAARVDLLGTVRSDTRIDGTTEPFGVTGAVQVRAIVILATGEMSGPGGPEVTVTGPQVTGSQPSVFLASNPPEVFTLEGSGFAPVGQRVEVRLTADSGTPFVVLGGASDRLDLTGVILSDTQVRGTMPAGIVSESTVAHVEVQHASDWVTADQGPDLTFWFQTKITPDDGEANDQFGADVSLSGDTAVIGARYDDEKASGAGAAYVFVRSGIAWMQQAKLTATDGAADEAIGSSVAIDGDTAVVSSWEAGAAYVFVRSGTTWTQQATLTASDGWAGDDFGGDVAISDDTILVGARADDDQGANSGSAYVFTRIGTTWTQQQKLLPPTGAASATFGNSLAVLEDTALIGAPGDPLQAAYAGAAYVFVRSGTTWGYQQTLVASDAASNDAFGQSVALGPDRAVVGADKGDGVVAGTGSVYVYRRIGTAWPEEQELFASDGAPTELFGCDVDIWANKILVGAWLEGLAPTYPGAAYVFARSLTTWAEQQKLTPSDGADSDFFGLSVAIDGGRALVGASHHDVNGGQSGAAYIH